MYRNLPQQPLSRPQALAEKAFVALERFLHVEAVSGIVLLLAAALALVWANSSHAAGYHAFWHTPLTLGVGEWVFSRPLHFWINDALMTVFFLVVGMEIRREIHGGALASPKLAALPLVAALGGVAVPALVYFALNGEPPRSHGWAVPTATDIAFAVGVLALLGRSIPAGVRVFLLALAIIDDIVAVLIIALFYSGGLEPTGLLIAALGIALILGMRLIGIGAALVYVVPGAVIWIGLLLSGAHPTLAGVVLGLMTPVRPGRRRERPLDTAARAIESMGREAAAGHEALIQPLKDLRRAQRDLLPPVTRVQMILHPWVAYGVMPLFALANAGVSLEGVHLGQEGAWQVLAGTFLALVLGKPLGVIALSALAVRLGWCRLPPGVGWGGVILVGCLAGIGFTMSIFIANLAFVDADLLGAAKLGVLLASSVAAVIGLCWGVLYRHRLSAGSASAPT